MNDHSPPNPTVDPPLVEKGFQDEVNVDATIKDDPENSEMKALLKEVSFLRSNNATLEARLAKLEATNKKPETALVKQPSSLTRGLSQIDDDTEQALHEDTYAFILNSPLCSYSFYLGLIVFLVQEAVFFLMLWSLTGIGESDDFDATDFGIPVNVDPAVRILQMVAMAFTVVTQTDIIKGLDLTRLIGNRSFRDNYPHIPTWRILLCIITLLLEGLVGTLVSFVLIVTSDNVVDLLLNFTAMAFVSELDEAIFYVTQHGFFGVACKNEADAVGEVTYEVDKKARRRREIVMLITIFLGLVTGWGVVVYNQNQGLYQCSTILVQMGDDVSPALGTFSGLYDMQKPAKEGLLRSGQHMVYVERQSGRASFAYCDSLGAWTFRWHDKGQAGQDPCDWAVMSSQTDSYDITVPGEEGTWYAKDDNSRVVVLDPFFLQCYECGKEEVGNDDECNGRGTCSDGAWSCEEGYFGLRCEFLEPCLSLAIDARTDGFLGTRPWSDTYEQLQVAAARAEEDGDSESTAMVPLEVYHRPVYLNEYEEGKFDLIFFTGRRWVVTNSDSLFDAPSMDDGKPKVSLAEYFQEHFHAHWSNFSIAFVSDALDVATPGDANSPLNLAFFQAAPQTNAAPMDIQGVGGLQSNARLLCAICNNQTNPCSYDGQCTEQGICSCPMSLGSLCEVPPVGNGFCNPYYNSPQFNWDGGDCCAQTCTSDQEFICGMDTSGYGSIGYQNCKEIPAGVWIPDDMSWEFVDNVALSDNGEFLVVSSSSTDQAYMYDKVGGDWVQRGGLLEISHRKMTEEDPVQIRIIGLSPGLVNKPATGHPPYLVTFPDFDDSGDYLIRRVRCLESCVDLQTRSFDASSSIYSSTSAYAVAREAPYLAVLNQTEGNEHVLALALDESFFPFVRSIIYSEDGPSNSVSLSADGSTLAVQSVVDSEDGIPTFAVTVYDWNWGAKDYDVRSNSFQFNGSMDAYGCSTSVELSGDGTTVAFTTADQNSGSTRVQVHTWDEYSLSWNKMGSFPLNGSLADGPLSEAISLSGDGRSLVYRSGKNVSVHDWDGSAWLVADRPVSSFLDGISNVASLAMDQDASAVAMVTEDEIGTQAAHVVSMPGSQECPDDMSLLRVSVTLDQQPDTKTWTLEEKKTGKPLFHRTLLPHMIYSPTATYASQSCIAKDSCHALSLYAHENDRFQPPGGYSVTLDGKQIFKNADHASFEIKRISIGNCLFCEPGMEPLRFLLSTCKTTASWRLLDGSGQQVFEGNSSGIEVDAAHLHTCQDNFWQHGKKYNVKAPFWEEVCIDPQKCYSLYVSAPWSSSKYYVFKGENITGNINVLDGAEVYQDDGQTKVWRIGNCAALASQTASPTSSQAPTSSPTVWMAPTGTTTPTSGYHISEMDMDWPGQYPQAPNFVTINLRIDDTPLDREWNWSALVDPREMTWKQLRAETIPEYEEYKVVSYRLAVENGSIYRFETRDIYDDGFSQCVGDPEQAYGWFTITGLSPEGNDGAVIWEEWGKGPRWDPEGANGAFDYDVLIWIDSEGYAHQVLWVEGQGFALAEKDGSLPLDPTIVLQVTYAPTISPAPTTLAPTFSKAPSPWPTASPFDPERDDPEWPGLFPDPGNSTTNAVTINIRTDEFPEELVWGWAVWSDGGFPSQTADLQYIFNDTLSEDQKEVVVSLNMTVEPGLVYWLVIQDTWDGWCCGLFGDGWITITSAESTVEDHPEGTVLHQRTGDQMRTTSDGLTQIMDLQIWGDPNGYPRAVDFVPDLGYVLSNADGSIPEEPTVVLPLPIEV